MNDLELDALKAHVATCRFCSAASKRVNDFCPLGQLLFFDYAKDHAPVSAEEVEITKEQCDRLVAEITRRRQNFGRN